MTATPGKPWSGLLIFGLAVFLVFCLLFEEAIRLPGWLTWLGRWHLVLLHFPIVLLLVIVFYAVTARTLPMTFFTAAVLFALITAISGFFLGTANEPKTSLLLKHQWLGAGVALVSTFWYGIELRWPGRKLYTGVFSVSLLILVGMTGHFGGMVTHGEDFLALPTTQKEGPIPENPLIYKHVVARMLENHCISCHNGNKRKGELEMTSLTHLLKGGESGKTIIPGHPEESEMLRRLHLPADDEEHMPPEGKKSLNSTEIEIIEHWVALGASDTLRLDHLSDQESLAGLVRSLMTPNPLSRWSGLKKVADTTLSRLSSDYISLHRVAEGSQALVLKAYLPPVYNTDTLMVVGEVAPNLVEMDLSGLPLTSREMEFITQCTQVEKLELDGTTITDETLALIKQLSNVRNLKIYGTDLTDKSIPVIAGLKSLENLYVWDTGISEKGLSELHTAFPKLKIVKGVKEFPQNNVPQEDSLNINPGR